jgi:hypothetical protein
VVHHLLNFLRGRRKQAGLREIQHLDRRQFIVRIAVAELALIAPAPAPHGAVGFSGAAMRYAGVHGSPACKAGNLHRGESVGGRAAAELASIRTYRRSMSSPLCVGFHAYSRPYKLNAQTTWWRFSCSMCWGSSYASPEAHTAYTIFVHFWPRPRRMVACA